MQSIMGRGAQNEVCEVGLCLPNQRVKRLAHLQGEVPQRCVLVVLALEVLQRDDDRPGCLADRDCRGSLSHRRPDELDHLLERLQGHTVGRLTCPDR